MARSSHAWIFEPHGQHKVSEEQEGNVAETEAFGEELRRAQRQPRQEQGLVRAQLVPQEPETAGCVLQALDIHIVNHLNYQLRHATSQPMKKQQQPITSFFAPKDAISAPAALVSPVSPAKPSKLPAAKPQSPSVLSPSKRVSTRRQNDVDLMELMFDDDDDDEQPSATPANSMVESASPKRRKVALFNTFLVIFIQETALEKKKANEQRYSWLLDIRDKNKNDQSSPDYDKRTLFIPREAWEKFTEFEKQYWEIKSDHWDTVVFFKKGKFYGEFKLESLNKFEFEHCILFLMIELYEKDADIGHQHFDLKLTDRVNMKMVGVPEKSFDHWASQFIAKGYKVAKVNQMENAVGKSLREKQAKSEKGKRARDDKESTIIKRELTSILTAGTLVDSTMLTDDFSTYCLSLKEDVSEHLPPTFGVSFVDTSTAEFNICSFTDDIHRTKFETLLLQLKPKELVLEKGGLSQISLRILKNNLRAPQINYLVPEKEFYDAQRTRAELTELIADEDMDGRQGA
ncbi:DNA mismatch repair protein msh6, partial [Nowakowskiella sp. JEL0078]